MVAFYNAKDQAIYNAGDKFVPQTKYLQNDYVPTEGISYEGDGSPVSYANSGIMSGYMTPPKIIYPPINESGGDGPVDPGPPDYGYTGPGSTGSVGGFNIDDIGEGTIDDEDMPGITGKGLMGLAGFVANPVGFFTKKAVNIAKQKYENKKRRDKAAQDLADQAALDKAYADQIAAQGSTTGSYNTGGRYDGADSQSSYDADPTGYSGSSREGGLMGYGGKSGTPKYQQYFKGGRVGYRSGGFSVLGSSSMTDAVMKRIEALMDEGLDFGSAYTQVKKEAPALAHGGRVKSNNSGSLTEFVKSKLMEDDSQGLPAVQGIAIGMPSDQDGIISISRR